ncbi:MAG: hypothetical protein WCS65_04355 [Verrucomicrobiae bacterium]
MKILIAIAWVFVAAVLQAGDPAGALACLQNLPAKYQHGVLKLSADNANPNPDLWHLSVQSGGNNSNIHHLTMSDGQILSDGRTLGFREILSQASPISVDKMTVDSTDAFAIVRSYARANRLTVGSVCFALEQRGGSAAPIWSVWCYDPSGSYLGLMKILATDGRVLSNNAFSKRP